MPDTSDYVKALSHPLRVEALVRFDLAARRAADGEPHDGARPGAYSPSELAKIIDAPLPNISYHVRELARLGLIVKAGRPAQRRGALEHYYQARMSADEMLGVAARSLVEIRERVSP